jgi:hypothetical protein
MKLKTRHVIESLLKQAGYFVDDTYISKKYPKTLNVILDICKSKTKGFESARFAMKNAPLDEFVEVSLAWTEKSVDKKFKGKPIIGCIQFMYDVGPTTKQSIYHVDHPSWRTKQTLEFK